jgi:peptidoglycan/xylan/chitin deacetylase (PgdA/CDA1 family)
MSLHHQILAASYYPIKLTKTIGRLLGLSSANKLRVLLYHDIAPRDQANFAAQLRWLKRTWNFVTVDQYVAMVSGQAPIRGRNLLLTFDDGLASNRRIVEKVLNPLGIQALFFVISGFVNLSDKDNWRGFVAKNIHPGMKPEDVHDHWKNMTWSDLAYLLETGHSIGCHTANHARLSQVAAEDLEAEIIESANVLEQKLGIKVDHFAYTFGNLASFSPAALAIARSRFKYIYTGLRGDSSSSIPSWAIRRDSITAVDSLSLVGALLEGGADRFYRDKLAEYESWGRSA